MNVLLIILTVLVGLLVTGAIYQAIATRLDKRRFPPPGQLVDVGGHRLHLNVTGSSGDRPTVILEAGMASISSNWGWVQQELAKTTQVVSYDRAGLGWSDTGEKPLDAAKSARELHTALKKSNINGRYVLAGHSYGGLVVRMFAELYPDEVAGIVLVDSSHPDQWAHIPASKGGQTVAIGNRITAFIARFGIMRLFHLEESFIKGLPPREYAEMRAYLSTPNGWLAGADGLIAWRDLSQQQVNAAHSLGNLPLFVLSVTEQDRYANVLTSLQAELPRLSSNSKHVTVEDATHYTLVSMQSYGSVVSDAILQVIDAVSTGEPLADENAPVAAFSHIPV
jgi:pimeloyl-ACP methyl ester carboxylesterase